MIWLLWAGVASAQQLSLSYDEAVERALEQNPDLIRAQADIVSARGRVMASRGVFDPQLTSSYSFSRSSSQSFVQQPGSFDFVCAFDQIEPAIVDAINGEEPDIDVSGCNTGVSNFLLDSASSRAEYNLGVNGFLPTGTTVGVSLFGLEQINEQSISGAESTIQQSYTTNATLNVRQPLLQGYRTTFNLSGVRSAKRNLTRTEAAELERRQQTLADAANAYWNLFYQQIFENISKETVKVTQEERRIVIARIEQGDLAPVERSRVEAAVLDAQSNLLTAQNTTQDAEDALLLLLGEEPGQDVAITSTPALISVGGLDVNAAIEDALQNNANLLQLRETESLAEQSLADAKHTLLPELTGTGSYGLSGADEEGFATSISELTTGDLQNWSLGLELSMPLGNRADRGLYQQRVAELESARVSRESAERGLRQQVRAQVRSVRSAQLQIDLAQANLQAAEQTLDADRALRDAGRAIEKDVLESIRDVDNARVALERAKADYNLALIELNRLRGAL
ncbi:MAG: TolC family protein [Myxococcota bacterium]